MDTNAYVIRVYGEYTRIVINLHRLSRKPHICTPDSLAAEACESAGYGRCGRGIRVTTGQEDYVHRVVLRVRRVKLKSKKGHE